MVGIKMTKKGISPLIATVLLIGFTIVLAAVVMQWGGGFVRNLTTQQDVLVTTTTGCMQINFDLTEAEYESTGGGGDLYFKITNNEDKGIDKFIGLIENKIGSNPLNSVTNPNPLDSSTCAPGPFETRKCAVLNVEGITAGDKLKLIPMIKLSDGTLKGCSADSAKVVDIVYPET